MISERTHVIARVCHAAEKSWREEHGETVPAWGDITDEEKDISLQGVDFLLDNPHLGAAALHLDWINRMTEKKWTYGPVFDKKTKTHPIMIPFGQLGPAEQTVGLMRRAIVQNLGRV